MLHSNFYRLSDAGYTLGVRLLELISYREKNNKRETKLVNMLTFIAYTVWKVLFGKTADSLEKSTEHADECEAETCVTLTSQI